MTAMVLRKIYLLNHSLPLIAYQAILKQPRKEKLYRSFDREYYALWKRHAWSDIWPTPDMNPEPFTWVFRLKGALHKGRCWFRGDF